MLISFLIPVYNEEKRIHKAITALEKYLKTFKENHEVIFIDDGSQDGTIAKIKASKPKFKYEILSYTPNHGKGYVIKKGMLQAKGDYRLFFDVDMSTPLEEFSKFLPHLDKKVVLIGNRKQEGAKVVKHQPFLREKMGQVFTLLARGLVVGEVTDFTCGFKLFPKEVALKVFKKARVERWGYDAEILFLTKKFGYKIKQIPVRWADDPRTRVTLLKDSVQSFTDLLLIRLTDLQGKYR